VFLWYSFSFSISTFLSLFLFSFILAILLQFSMFPFLSSPFFLCQSFYLAVSE
jgi:hypothetical protein